MAYVAQAETDEFQHSLKETVSEETGVSVGNITVTVASRRDVDIDVTLQTETEQAATGVSDAVAAADASGDIVKRINTKLTASGSNMSVSGSTITRISRTPNRSSGGNDDDNTVLIAVCVSVGVLLLIATAFVLYWQVGRTKSPSCDEVDTVNKHAAPTAPVPSSIEVALNIGVSKK